MFNITKYANFIISLALIPIVFVVNSKSTKMSFACLLLTSLLNSLLIHIVITLTSSLVKGVFSFSFSVSSYIGDNSMFAGAETFLSSFTVECIGAGGKGMASLFETACYNKE